MHDVLTGSGYDFAATDERFAEFLASAAAWLGDDAAYRARLGLHELLVNVRCHAYLEGDGPIEVGATASGSALTVTVTDWGVGMTELPAASMPALSDAGGYGLPIIDLTFDEVTYRRGGGRNEWQLTLTARGARAR